MIFDFWNNGTIQDVYSVMLWFSEIDCKYRGIMRGKDGAAIGDFTGTDSTEIERYFPGIFND